MAGRLLTLCVWSGALAALSGAGQAAADPACFISVDKEGRIIATVTLEQRLPPYDTALVFTGPYSDPASISRPMTFETASAFRCHGSDLIVICQTAEQTPAQARISGGGYVRRLDADTILVSDTPGGMAGDFATFKNGQLVAFGVMDETGTTGWRYDAR